MLNHYRSYSNRNKKYIWIRLMMVRVINPNVFIINSIMLKVVLAILFFFCKIRRECYTFIKKKFGYWLKRFIHQRGEWVKASILRRPWSNDLGSTRILVTLLRPWIRRFTMIISAWWLWTGSKFSGQEFEEIHRNIGSTEILNQVLIPPITK